jgi:hypothetical protein
MTRGFSSALTPNPAAESAPMRPRPSSLQPAGRWDASEEQVCACAFYLYTHHSCVLTAAAAPSLRPGTPAHPHTRTPGHAQVQDVSLPSPNLDILLNKTAKKVVDKVRKDVPAISPALVVRTRS